MDKKIRTYVSILSGGTGDSINTEKLIPIKKMNIKSPAMSPPRKDPITNQYTNIFSTKKYQSLPPHLEKYPPGYKSLLNDAHDPNSTEDELNDSTVNSHNEKEDPVNNLKVTNN